VVHGCAYNGKPDGGVYAVPEMYELERNQPLVVIHANYGVKAPFKRIEKYGIRGQRIRNIKPLLPGLYYCR
jgi:hypothetical protein